jgi:hypothetical protein
MHASWDSLSPMLRSSGFAGLRRDSRFSMRARCALAKADYQPARADFLLEEARATRRMDGFFTDLRAVTFLVVFFAAVFAFSVRFAGDFFAVFLAVVFFFNIVSSFKEIDINIAYVRVYSLKFR